MHGVVICGLLELQVFYNIVRGPDLFKWILDRADGSDIGQSMDV